MAPAMSGTLSLSFSCFLCLHTLSPREDARSQSLERDTYFDLSLLGLPALDLEFLKRPPWIHSQPA